MSDEFRQADEREDSTVEHDESDPNAFVPDDAHIAAPLGEEAHDLPPLDSSVAEHIKDPAELDSYSWLSDSQLPPTQTPPTVESVVDDVLPGSVFADATIPDQVPDISSIDVPAAVENVVDAIQPGESQHLEEVVEQLLSTEVPPVPQVPVEVEAPAVPQASVDADVLLTDVKVPDDVTVPADMETLLTDVETPIVAAETDALNAVEAEPLHAAADLPTEDVTLPDVSSDLPDSEVLESLSPDVSTDVAAEVPQHALPDLSEGENVENNAEATLTEELPQENPDLPSVIEAEPSVDVDQPSVSVEQPVIDVSEVSADVHVEEPPIDVSETVDVEVPAVTQVETPDIPEIITDAQASVDAQIPADVEVPNGDVEVPSVTELSADVDVPTVTELSTDVDVPVVTEVPVVAEVPNEVEAPDVVQELPDVNGDLPSADVQEPSSAGASIAELMEASLRENADTSDNEATGALLTAEESPQENPDLPTASEGASIEELPGTTPEVSTDVEEPPTADAEVPQDTNGLEPSSAEEPTHVNEPTDADQEEPIAWLNDAATDGGQGVAQPSEIPDSSLLINADAVPQDTIPPQMPSDMGTDLSTPPYPDVNLPTGEAGPDSGLPTAPDQELPTSASALIKLFQGPTTQETTLPQETTSSWLTEQPSSGVVPPDMSGTGYVPPEGTYPSQDGYNSAYVPPVTPTPEIPVPAGSYAYTGAAPLETVPTPVPPSQGYSSVIAPMSPVGGEEQGPGAYPQQREQKPSRRSEKAQHGKGKGSRKAPAARKAKKSLVWIPILLSILAFLVILALIAWFLIRPRLEQAEIITTNPAPDLVSTPKLADGVSMLANVKSEHQPYYTNVLQDARSKDVTVGYSQADYETFTMTHDSTGYYDGYTQDYEDGAAAGVACLNAPEPTPKGMGSTVWFFWQNNRVAYCTRYAKEPIADEARYTDATKIGYANGFDDGMDSTPGSRQIPPPDSLEEGSFVQGFSLVDAHSVWTYRLENTAITNPSIKLLAPQGAVPAMGQAANTYLLGDGSGQIAFIVSGVDAAGTPTQALTVLNVADGTQLAVVKLTDANASILAFANGTVVLTSPEGGSTAISSTNSSDTAWQTKDTIPADYAGPAPITINDQWVFDGKGYVAFADGAPAPFGSDVSDKVTYFGQQGDVFRFDSTAGSIMKIDPTTGASQWDQPISSSSQALAMDNSSVYASDGTKITAYSLSKGESRWSTDGSLPLGRVGQYLVAGQSDGKVQFVDTRSKTHEVYPGGPATQGFVGNNVAYLFTDADHSLNAYDLSFPPESLSDKSAWVMTLNEKQYLVLSGSTFVIWGDAGVVRVLS